MPVRRILIVLACACALACGVGADSAPDFGGGGSDSTPDTGGEPIELDAAAGSTASPLDVPAPGEGSDAALDEGQPADVVVPVDEGPGLGIDYEEEPAGDEVPYDPAGEDWLATGWPTDRLRGDDGRLDLSGFPRPGSAFWNDLLAYASEELRGYGLNGAVFFPMTRDLDPSSVPDPFATLDPLSAVQLVEVSGGSETFDRRVPVSLRHHDVAGDKYVPRGVLSVRGVLGAPLTEGRVWCAVLTRGLRDIDGGHLQPSEAFRRDLAMADHLGPLRAWLHHSPLRHDDIAVATCFTTQDATGELRKIAESLDAAEPPELLELRPLRGAFELHGRYDTPNFQTGEKPYQEHGDFELDEAGVPVVQHLERMRVLLLLPDRDEMPEAGWPVVLHAHGTTGDYESCRGVSRTLRPRGLAVLCIEQPLHGIRGPDGEALDEGALILASFNFLNPPAGRTGHRQSAADTMVLARMVESGRFDIEASAATGGREVRLDARRMGFFGHSQGGLSGALVLAVETRIRAAVLSGAGGGLMRTIELRDDLVDLRALASAMLGVRESRLDPHHPTLSVLQMVVDATDPMSYAPHWHGERADGGAHIFVSEGTHDGATPAVTTDALAAAAGLPLMVPRARTSVPHQAWGMEPLAGAVQGNIDTPAGPRTAALRQWQDGDHFVALWHPEAISMWGRFLDEALHGEVPILATDRSTIVEGARATAGSACEAAEVVEISAGAPLHLVGTTLLGADGGPPTCAADSKGAGHRDASYRLRAVEAGIYRARLWTLPEDRNGPPGGPDRLVVAADCDPEGDPCLAVEDDDDVRVDLGAGDEVILGIEGSTAAHQGPFDLLIEQVCADEPCEARECGRAGCTECGTCGEGLACDPDGRCVAVARGDACGDAIAIDAVPFELVGDTRALANRFASDGSEPCAGAARLGNGSRDMVFEWVAEQAGAYVARLDAEFDAVLRAAADCADPGVTCLGMRRAGSGPDELLLDVDAGDRVALIVDGAWNFSDAAGGFTLRLAECVPDCEGRSCGSDGCGGTCGACPEADRCEGEVECPIFDVLCVTKTECVEAAPGDGCPWAVAAGALPWTWEGTTADYHDDHAHGSSDCPGDGRAGGAGASDAVLAVAGVDEGLLKVAVEARFEIAAYVVTSCGDDEGPCLAGRRSDRGNATFHLDLGPDETAYVVVDGLSSRESGSFTAEVSQCVPGCGDAVCGSDGCGGSCGSCARGLRCFEGACELLVGDVCGAPVRLTELDERIRLDTRAYTDALAATCEGAEDGGSADVIHSFTPAASGAYAVDLVARFPARLEVLGACDGSDGPCVAGAEATDGRVHLEFDRAAEETFHVLVEGLGEADEGVFDLTISEACVPDCDGRECGDDGCGAVCGTCSPPADVCADGECVDPSAPEGRSCLAPTEVGSLPFVVAGDTRNDATNHFALAREHCPGWQSKGLASSDAVWRFAAPAAGTYEVTLTTPEHEGALWALTECGRPASCVGAADGSGVDHLVLELAAGEVVFVVVDGAGNVEPDEGPYSLRLSRREKE